MGKAKKEGRRRGKGVDQKRMRKDKRVADAKSGGGILKFKEGSTVLYVCPPAHDGEPVPYVEVQTCFKFGPKDRSILSAEGLEDSEPFRAALAERDIDFDDAREGWEFAEKHETMKTRWYFAVIPIAFRSSSGEEYEDLEPVVQMLGCGKQVYDAIMDVFFEEGDITDPDAAIFVKIKRTGSGMSTEYKGSTDRDSLKEPVEIDPKMWDLVMKSCVPGGDRDIHKFVASQVRSLSQVHAAHDGEEDDDEVETRKAKTTSRSASSRRRKKEAEPVDEDEEKPKKKGKKKKKGKAKKDKKPKAKKDKKPKPVDEDAEADDDEEEADVDELEAALAERAAKRDKRKGKKEAKAAE